MHSKTEYIQLTSTRQSLLYGSVQTHHESKRVVVHDCAHAKDTGQVTNVLFQGLPYFVLISFLHKAKKNEIGDHQGHEDPVNRVITETCGD